MGTPRGVRARARVFAAARPCQMPRSDFTGGLLSLSSARLLYPLFRGYGAVFFLYLVSGRARSDFFSRLLFAAVAAAAAAVPLLPLRADSIVLTFLFQGMMARRVFFVYICVLSVERGNHCPAH